MHLKHHLPRTSRSAHRALDRTGIPYLMLYVWRMLYLEPSMSGGVASTSGLTPRLLNAGAALLLVAPAALSRTLRRLLPG